jgi:hypothetical protein
MLRKYMIKVRIVTTTICHTILVTTLNTFRISIRMRVLKVMVTILTKELSKYTMATNMIVAACTIDFQVHTIKVLKLRDLPIYRV